jgi:hypothetical protein
MMALGIGLLAYLEDRLKWPSLLAYATSLALIFAICIPWWARAYPAIERALLRACHGALRAGVVLAIAVSAGGVWAYVLF